MFKRRALAIGAIGALTAVMACDNQNRTAQLGEQETEQSGQIVEREVTPEGTDLGQTAVERGETEAQAQKEIVRRETETMSEDVPTVTTGQAQLDVNRMEVEDFEVLGLDRQSAERIIQHREENGPFQSAQELAQVPGIDQQWLSQYQDRFAFISPDTEEQRAGEAADMNMNQ